VQTASRLRPPGIGMSPACRAAAWQLALLPSCPTPQELGRKDDLLLKEIDVLWQLWPSVAQFMEEVHEIAMNAPPLPYRPRRGKGAAGGDVEDEDVAQAVMVTASVAPRCGIRYLRMSVEPSLLRSYDSLPRRTSGVSVCASWSDLDKGRAPPTVSRQVPGCWTIPVAVPVQGRPPAPEGAHG
jgi:hypothetical protein